jgi:hypothetical protein
MSSAALEERAQDSLKRKGRVDFALFNIPHIAKSLMPVDNEPARGVAEPFRRYWQRKLTRREEKIDQLRSLRLPDGRNALMTTMSTARLLKFPPFLYFRHRSRLWTEGVHGALISVRVALKLQLSAAEQRFSPYREKVAEEMLLCEVMVQHRIKHHRSICL